VRENDPVATSSGSVDQGDDLGGLNLYSRRAGVFTEECEHVGSRFAAHAAVADAAARTKAGLGRAVATRQLIGQAQGMLMARHQLTGEQAFALLVRASQDRNVKLRELAEQRVYSGAFIAPS
jgi:AmiR/NasT family two-component response regulator